MGSLGFGLWAFFVELFFHEKRWLRAYGFKLGAIGCGQGFCKSCAEGTTILIYRRLHEVHPKSSLESQEDEPQPLTPNLVFQKTGPDKLETSATTQTVISTASEGWS